MKHLLAAFIFFTRLPFWRIASVPAGCFKCVVPYWPLTGWLTGGLLAGTLWVSAQVLPVSVAWTLAIIARIAATGCLHEDGLADFCDGFGGGATRERALAIMKDPHIGTFGTAGLAAYFLLRWQLSVLPLPVLCAVAFCGDVFSKGVCSHIVNLLPYARREEDAKAKVAYSRMTPAEAIAGAAAAVLPVAVLLPRGLWPACALPPLALGLLCLWMRRRLGGYTGDCCGAAFLLGELAFGLGCLALSSSPAEMRPFAAFLSPSPAHSP